MGSESLDPQSNSHNTTLTVEQSKSWEPRPQVSHSVYRVRGYGPKQLILEMAFSIHRTQLDEGAAIELTCWECGEDEIVH